MPEMPEAHNLALLYFNHGLLWGVAAHIVLSRLAFQDHNLHGDLLWEVHRLDGEVMLVWKASGP